MFVLLLSLLLSSSDGRRFDPQRAAFWTSRGRRYRPLPPPVLLGTYLRCHCAHQVRFSLPAATRSWFASSFANSRGLARSATEDVKKKVCVNEIHQSRSQPQCSLRNVLCTRNASQWVYVIFVRSSRVIAPKINFTVDIVSDWSTPVRSRRALHEQTGTWLTRKAQAYMPRQKVM